MGATPLWTPRRSALNGPNMIPLRAQPVGGGAPVDYAGRCRVQFSNARLCRWIAFMYRWTTICVAHTGGRMALDYHLDRTVRLSEESTHKGLYDWSIQEFEGDQQKGPDYIPWSWTAAFTATKITYRQHYGLGERYWFQRPGEQADSPEKSGFVEKQHIRADLRPGHPEGDDRQTPSYSMFGTTRAIKEFSLHIYPSENDEDGENCVVHGGLSYTVEVDFRDETPSDYVQFYITVSRRRFEDLCNRIKVGDFDHLVVSLNAIQGLYSEWSPSISARRIKVLTKPEDHKLVIPEGARIDPPVMKSLDQFDLHLVTERRMAQPIAVEDFGGSDHEDDSLVIDPEQARADRFALAVRTFEDRARKAQIALWVIAGLLVVSLLT